MPHSATCGRTQHSLQPGRRNLSPAFSQPASSCRQRCLAHQAARSRCAQHLASLSSTRCATGHHNAHGMSPTWLCRRRVCQPEAAGRGSAPAGREASTVKRRKGGETELRHGRRRPGSRRDEDGGGKPDRFYFAVTGCAVPGPRAACLTCCKAPVNLFSSHGRRLVGSLHFHN